jgi:ribosomal protein S18 acetylase RimI-like enzyme
MQVSIKHGSAEECYQIACLIPEFAGDSYPFDEYQNRLNHRRHILLIAEIDGQPAGFKIGYESNKSGVFYSWLGGVIPQFRKNRLATLLAEKQEEIAKENGFEMIEFKTRNYLKPMLLFALQRGFDIIEVEQQKKSHQNRIILQKQLR